MGKLELERYGQELHPEVLPNRSRVDDALGLVVAHVISGERTHVNAINLIKRINFAD